MLLARGAARGHSALSTRSTGAALPLICSQPARSLCSNAQCAEARRPARVAGVREGLGSTSSSSSDSAATPRNLSAAAASMPVQLLQAAPGNLQQQQQLFLQRDGPAAAAALGLGGPPQQQPWPHQHTQQPQQQPLPGSVLLIGVDPDTQGAIAIVRARLTWGTEAPPDPAASSSSGQRRRRSTTSAAEAPQQQARLCLPVSDVRLYDMPVQTIPLATKSRTGATRYRRRVDIPGAISLIQQAVQEAVTAIRQEQQQRAVLLASHAAGAASSSEHLLLQGVLEVASICPSNGSLATLNQGYSVGAWTAALAAAGFGVSTVHVQTWKRALGLLGRDHGKDASRALALAVARATEAAPQDELLRLKKDHGRAEALLIAAWGMGWSLDPATRSLQQGPLRDVLQMDGGMHTIAAAPAAAAAASVPPAVGLQADADDGGPGSGASMASVSLTQLERFLDAAPRRSSAGRKVLDVAAVMRARDEAKAAADEAKAAAKLAAKAARAEAKAAAAAGSRSQRAVVAARSRRRTLPLATAEAAAGHTTPQSQPPDDPPSSSSSAAMQLEPSAAAAGAPDDTRVAAAAATGGRRRRRSQRSSQR